MLMNNIENLRKYMYNHHHITKYVSLKSQNLSKTIRYFNVFVQKRGNIKSTH